MQKLYLAFGLSVVLAACGSSDNTKRGGLGESCTGKNDCTGNLVCMSNVCQNPGTITPTPDGGGTPVTPVTPAPVLSAIGESCTKTADCVAPGKCFSGTCALTAPIPVQPDAAVIYVVVDAGAPTNPVLGGRGETCSKSSDCEQGLICLPISATTGLGVCDIKTYGFTTGTNTCYAECKTKEDCCELPLGLTTTAGTPVNSCTDLLKAMKPNTEVDCSEVAAVSHECFLYKTYCNCAAANYWQCTEQKRCVYSNTCDPTVTGEAMKGCPTKSRAGFPLPACNATTKQCAAVAATGGCKNDSECVGMPVADGAGEVCGSGLTATALECACVVAAGTCYRRCNGELDCAPGYTCDFITGAAGSKLCKPAGECTTDSFCATKLKNAGAKCLALTAGGADKVCRLPCNTDQDCSPSGLAGSAFTGLICGADRFCGSMGCTSDAECSHAVAGTGTTSLGSVKMFCAAPVSATVVQWTSAITD
jgi:hypothetical protein